MRRLKVATLIALIVGLCALSLLGKQQDYKSKENRPRKKLGVDYVIGTFHEAGLRRNAIVTAMPEYPEDAVNAGAQGLAHVAVLFDENGEYHSMKVLDSPHPAISNAVAHALKKWKMTVGYDSPYPETRRPIRYLGPVQFHFIISDGVPRVEQASWEAQRRLTEKFTQATTGKRLRLMQD